MCHGTGDSGGLGGVDRNPAITPFDLLPPLPPPVRARTLNVEPLSSLLVRARLSQLLHYAVYCWNLPRRVLKGTKQGCPLGLRDPRRGLDPS